MLKNLAVGDKVRWINQPWEGIILSIIGQRAEVKLTDGFTEWVSIKELVLNMNDVELKEVSEKNLSSHIIYRKILTEEIDLHIENLFVHWRSIPTEQILTRQLNAFEEELRSAIYHKKDRLIAIHGKGEGILKANIINILKSKFSFEYVEMNYGKYKNAAIEIFLVGQN